MMTNVYKTKLDERLIENYKKRIDNCTLKKSILIMIISDLRADTQISNEAMIEVMLYANSKINE